jgi:NitT/TauT family transport system substrate-binding protein
MLPQPFPGTAEAEGFGRILAWGGDLLPWQIAAIFYSRRFAADRERAVAFMKGYVQASRYYHDAVLARRDGRPPSGPAWEEVVAITARYTGAKPEIIRLGFPYQDRDGRLMVQDIEKQIQWWVRHGFMKAAVPLAEIVDTSFVEAAVAALGR